MKEMEKSRKTDIHLMRESLNMGSSVEMSPHVKSVPYLERIGLCSRDMIPVGKVNDSELT